MYVRHQKKDKDAHERPETFVYISPKPGSKLRYKVGGISGAEQGADLEQMEAWAASKSSNGSQARG